MFADFVEETYLPWSRIHKASYDDDVRTTSVLTNFFKGKNLREIKPVMVEQYKAKRIGAGRAQATVMQERKREALEKLVSFSPRQRDAKNVTKEKWQGARPAVNT